MKITSGLKLLFNVVIVILLSVLVILFSGLYLKTLSSGYIYKNRELILFLISIIVCLLGVLAIIFSVSNSAFIYKLTIVVLGLLSIILISLYVFKVSGLIDKIKSIEDLRNYVASFGILAPIIYIIMNFLQVVILPIPGFIAILAGVAIFGPFKASIFSFVGILTGSLVAFFIGRILGYKVVSWLVSKGTLEKWLKTVKNKDKVILTFMFLFPFFPDDVLCFVAGLSSMSSLYFVVMIVICRVISVLTTSYSINGNVIPYTTWWGILIWIIILGLTVYLTSYLYKNGDNIEKRLQKCFKRKK